MKKILLIILPLLLIVGCSKVEGQQLISRVEIGERGKIEITYYKKTQNRIESVKYERYHKNGQKELEETYKDGKKDGLWTGWYDNGQKEVEGTYKDGKKDGLWTEWHINGQKLRESTYKNGKEDGLQTIWYENGEKEEGIYKDDKKDGLWTGWYSNGQKLYERNYKDGKRISSKKWNSDGSVKE